MGKFISVGGPSAGSSAIGVRLDSVCSTFWNRAGATIAAGAHVQLDLAAVNAEVVTTTDGAENSVFNTVMDPVGNTSIVGLMAGIFAIALEDVADNTIGKFLLRGRVDAALVTGTVVEGTLLVASTTNRLVLAGTTAAKIIAISLAIDSDGTADEVEVWFDGIDGFGTALDA